MLYQSSCLLKLALLLLSINTLYGDGVAALHSNDASCSLHFQELTANNYDKNADNFVNVFNFLKLSKNLNFKADIMLGLYNAMSSLGHTENPLRAITLYNELESLINSNSTDLKLEQYQAMDTARNQLALIIIEKGAEVLEAAVLLKNYSLVNSPMQHLFDELYNSNRTLSNLTIINMVEKVRWLVPTKELTTTVSSISTHLIQNIDAMLALYNEDQFNSVVLIKLFLDRLWALTVNPNYAIEVPEETQWRVKPFQSAKILHDGKVCLIQSGRGIFDCNGNICLRNRYSRQSQFKVVYQHNKKVYNFIGRENNGYIINDQEELKFSDIFSESIDWKLEFEGDRVIMQNMNDSMYLCTSLNEYSEYNVILLDSYNKHNEKCQWKVSNFY